MVHNVSVFFVGKVVIYGLMCSYRFLLMQVNCFILLCLLFHAFVSLLIQLCNHLLEFFVFATRKAVYSLLFARVLVAPSTFSFQSFDLIYITKVDSEIFPFVKCIIFKIPIIPLNSCI